MMPTIIVATIIGAIFLAIVISGIRNIKNGKHSCSCGGSCGSCGMNGMCHANKNSQDNV